MIWIVLVGIRGAAIGLVLGDTDPGIYANALLYLKCISALFILHGSLMIFRNTLQGLGHSTLAMLFGLSELIGRGLAVCSAQASVLLPYALPIKWPGVYLFAAVPSPYCASFAGIRVRISSPQIPLWHGYSFSLHCGLCPRSRQSGDTAMLSKER